MTVRYSAGVDWVELVPFARETPEPGVSARVERHAGTLALAYRLLDPARVVRLAASMGSPARIDRLWESTCFEAFFGATGAPGYWELNLSSAGAWNLFRFDGYRLGMRTQPTSTAPLIRTTTTGDAFLLEATLPAPVGGPLDVGLTAVLELTSGRRTYWALRHTRPQPDFHARDAFVVHLAEDR